MTTKDNSWVLITGASSGFGEEFARQYAEQGHSLVLVARRLDRLQVLAEALRRQYRIDVVVVTFHRFFGHQQAALTPPALSHLRHA